MAIKLKCGSVSYAEIPIYYDFILGVTGTLKGLHPKIFDSLNYYKFIALTYQPSLYEESDI